MSNLMDHAAAALDELTQRVPKIVARDAPPPSAYALAIWFEWSRGDWFRWLPMLTVMQQRRIDAGLRLGVDPRVGFWDPWGVPAEAWAGRNEISHGTAGVIAGAAADLSVSPRAGRVFEPLQDAWLDLDEPTEDGLLFEEWFGIQLARRLDPMDWRRSLPTVGSELVVYAWPDRGRKAPALAASVAERHQLALTAQGVWPPSG